MANLHKWQEFALLATGTSKPARGDLGAQQGSPDSLCSGIQRVESCLIFFCFKYFCLFQKEKRRNCREEVSVWGLFFFPKGGLDI